MSRFASYLTGVLFGAIVTASLFLGHESQWVPFGPVEGMMFGIMGGVLIGCLLISLDLDE